MEAEVGVRIDLEDLAEGIAVANIRPADLAAFELANVVVIERARDAWAGIVEDLGDEPRQFGARHALTVPGRRLLALAGLA
jgi:hypothetical protein